MGKRNKGSYSLKAPFATKALVAGHDALFMAIIAFLLCAGSPSLAYAYVDPSVMTYTIQAVAGVAVALSALAGVFFRRSRKALLKAFNIDEDAKKVREGPVKRIDPSRKALVDDAATFQAKGARGYANNADGGSKWSSSDRDGFGRRFVLSLLTSAFLVITLFVVAPFEILAGSESSLVFGLQFVWQPILIAAAVLVVVLSLIISLCRGKAFMVVLMLTFSIGLCCYVQALFLNAGLPTTDGRFSSWGDFKIVAAWTSLVWVAIIAVSVGLGLKRRKAAQLVAGCLSIALIVVQSVAATSVLTASFSSHHVEDGSVPANQYTLTQGDMFTVSPEKNVIVFVLDTYDTTDMIRNLELDSSLAQSLSGFTWFKNSVGAMSPTRYGAPFLLTGVYPSADEPFEEFAAQRFLRSSYLDDIFSAGYSIGLYTDTLGDYLMSDSDRRSLIYDKTVNIKAPEPDEAPRLNLNGAFRMLVKSAFYRDLPWLTKPFTYFTTDEMNQAMVDMVPVDAESSTDSTPYVMDDGQWYISLQQLGLSFENREDKGAFRFIHLSGTHHPYNIDENGVDVGRDHSSLEQQSLGSMRMVLYYLDQMKKLGVYDDATIIITADHGIWWESYITPLPWISSPLLLVKPAGVGGGDLQESDAEVTAYDILPTVIKAIYGESGDYGPTLFEQNEVNRDRRYYLTYCVNNKDLLVEEYSIIGDVLDEEAWTATGTEFDPSNTPR